MLFFAIERHFSHATLFSMLLSDTGFHADISMPLMPPPFSITPLRAADDFVFRHYAAFAKLRASRSKRRCAILLPPPLSILFAAYAMPLSPLFRHADIFDIIFAFAFATPAPY
jgi:hypothetical protein